MDLYLYLLVSLSTIYAIGLMLLRTGLKRNEPATNHLDIFVSVIVAARNEETNIEACLKHLLLQSYSSYEVIVVDDRSTDRTAEILAAYAKRYNKLRYLKVHTLNLPAPKKNAIALGIRHARGEIIVTTDADCLPGKKWLEKTVVQFGQKVGLVAGFNPYVAHAKDSLFTKMLALDYFAMAAVAAATAGKYYPISCSAGNLAYRKQIYTQLGGFKNISALISGDDDLFLQKVRDESDWEIRYSMDPNTFVPTAPPATLQEFVNQRIRYASKGLLYSKPVVLSLAVVYLLNIGLAIAIITTIFGQASLTLLLACVSIKTASEYFFLKKARHIFQYRISFKIFPLTALVHPFYISCAGLLGQFKQFTWKGETHITKIKKTELALD